MAKILAVQETRVNISDVKLSLKGHDLIVARTFERALKYLSTEKFDLIICAVHLETGCVYDLLKLVKNDPKHRETPFVFFCNRPTQIAQFVSESTEATARILGADRYITTLDFQPDKFRREIESLLEQPHLVSDPQRLMSEARTHAQAAVLAGRWDEAEQILKTLLQEMYQNPALYFPVDLASIQYELAEVLDNEGKCAEARVSRESIQDF